MKNISVCIMGIGFLNVCFGKPIYGYMILAVACVIYPLQEGERE